MSAITKPINASKVRGRPPAFNQEDALEKALKVFWTHGYEGTSMSDLTRELKINKPSIYAAFGNKEALFRKALAMYISKPAAFINEAISQPTAQQVIEKFLIGAIECFTDVSTPNGCMVVQAALTCGESSSAIQTELINHRKNYEDALSKRFDLAKKQGNLPQQMNSIQLAKYLATIHQGLSVQASSGATKQELLDVVKMALTNIL